MIKRIFSTPKLTEVIEFEFVFKGDKARQIKALCDNTDTHLHRYDLWNFIQNELPTQDVSSQSHWRINNSDALSTKVIKYRIE
jgi:hypothetical protein